MFRYRIRAAVPFILGQVRRLKIPAINLPLTVTMVSWALNFPLLKVVNRQVEPSAVSLIRFAGMYLALLAICKFQGASLRFDRRDAFKVTWLGFVSMGIYMIFFLEGMKLTSPNEGAIILASTPILTGLLAIAFRQERFSLGWLAGAVVGFVGVAIVIRGGAGDPGSFKGNLLIFVGAVLWSYSAVLMRGLLGRYQPVQLLTMAMPGALIALLPYGLAQAIHTNWTGLSPISWIALLHLAVFSGALGFAGFYAGVRQIGAGGAMLYQYFVPPMTALLAWWIVGQVLQSAQWAGMAVVIGGVAISMRFRGAATQMEGRAQPNQEVCTDHEDVVPT